MKGMLLRDVKLNDTQYRYVYVLIINSGSGFSKVLKRFSGDPYNHASISFDKSLSKMYSFNANVNGMVAEDLKRDYIPEANFSLYRTRVTRKQYDEMKAIAEEMLSDKEKYKYNFKGLAGVLLNKPMGGENEFYCSEYVAYLFQKVKAPFFNKDVSLIKPYDFAKNKFFNFCYRGTVKGYSPDRVKD